MNARNLITLAESKGYSVGRNHPGQYRYANTEGGKHVERTFDGKWHQFVAFMRAL